MSAAAASGVSVAARPRPVGSLPWSVPIAVLGAWSILVILQVTGDAAVLHHHALIEDGPSLWLAVPMFLAGWLVAGRGRQFSLRFALFRNQSALPRDSFQTAN